METMEQQRQSLSSSLPMLTRLDHLDFVIKNLEKQQNLTKWKDGGAASTRGFNDKNSTREAYFKGSLLDRIAALETRIFQICLELESTSASSSTTGETSSQKIKRDLTKSLPIFNSNVNPFHIPLQHPQDPQEVDEKIEEEREEEIKISKPLLEKVANETCKSKKKKKKKSKFPILKWPRFNFFGC